MKTMENSIKENPDHIDEPGFLKEIRSKAHSLYRNSSLPSENDESWRKVKLRDLNIFEYDATSSSNHFSNAIDAKIDESVFDSFIQDILSVADIFTLRTLSLFQKPVSIAAATGTIRIKHSGTLFLNFIHVPDNGELTVIENHEGCNSLTTGLTLIVLGNNASLHHVSVRKLKENDLCFPRTEIRLGRNARFHSSMVHTGGAITKFFQIVNLLEEGAMYEGRGIYCGSGTECCDAEMVLHHHASHQESSILYKAVTKDRSHSIFNGNLNIPKGLKDIHSQQMNRNITLNQKARAESMPKLLVQSEDVSAEHGATVGEIDKEALFFLMARGLPEQEARALLIEGFIQEIIHGIPFDEEESESLVKELIGRVIG
jgi:uncharacterized protein